MRSTGRLKWDRRQWGAYLGCWLALCVAASAQQGDAEPSTSAGSAPTAGAAASAPTTGPGGASAAGGAGAAAAGGGGPAALAYQQTLAEWRPLLVKLRDLKAQRNQIALPEELPAVQAEFDATATKVRELIPVLRERAVAAFLENPNADRELLRFLMDMLADNLKRDEYDLAYPLSEALIQGKCEDRKIYEMAGAAAFATHHFTQAKNYYQEAMSLGKLSDQNMAWASSVDEYIADWPREESLRAAEQQADNLPQVRLKTTKGEIVIELFENEAPETVGNFISLVESGFYDGLNFHRVLPQFMAQGGCPKGDGSGGPGYNIYCECYSKNYRKHYRGSLSMAKSENRDSGGSQFFLTFVPTPHLNGKHTVFGRVIQGLELLEKIQRIDPEVPAEASRVPDKIQKAEVIRKRDHTYLPNKVRSAS